MQIKLGTAVSYSKSKTSKDSLTLDNYVSVDNLLQNKHGIKRSEKLPPQNNDVSFYEPGNILIGNIRPYLKKIWYATHQGGASPDVLVLQAKNGFDPKFIYYAISRDEFFEHIMRGYKGTRMPRGDKNQIMDFKIPDFEYTHQVKISSFLSALDAKIELNNRINTELEAMAKTLYDYWFVQFDFPYNFKTGKPDPNGKPYKSSGGKMVWNDELKREIPEGWKVQKLDQFGSFKNGINYDPSNPGDTEAHIINVRDISSSTLFIPPFNLDTLMLTQGEISNYCVTPNDIIVARSGIPGSVRLIEKTLINTIYCGFIIRFNVLNINYKYFLFFFLKDLESLNTAQAGGTILQNVSQDTLKRLIIPNPPEVLPLIFKNYIDPIFGKLNFSLNENYELTQLRDWLLPMLMNGRVYLD